MGYPIVGLLAALAAALGLYTMYWYENLSKEEKAAADRYAVELARKLYSKGLDELTSAQLDRVTGLVKSRFAA